MIGCWTALIGLLASTTTIISLETVDGEFVSELCSGTSSRKCFSVYHHTSGVDWENANSICAAQRNGSLVEIEDRDDQNELFGTLFKGVPRNITQKSANAWIGGQENSSNVWHWLGGTKYKGTLNMHTDNYRTCAVLERENNGVLAINSRDCTSNIGGYMCQKQNTNLGCSDGQEVYLATTRHCLYYSRTKYRWYQAERECAKRGSRLSVLGNYDPSSNGATYLRNLTSLYPGPVWIGLRRRRWEWMTLRHRRPKEAVFTYTNWKPDQPSSGNQKCAIIDVKDGRWSDYECGNKIHLFICQNKTGPAPTSPTATASLSQDKIIIMAVLLPLVIVLLIVISVLVFLLRRRSKRLHKTPSQSESTEHQSSTEYANSFGGQAEGQLCNYEARSGKGGTFPDTIVSDYSEIRNLPDLTHRGSTPQGQPQDNPVIVGTGHPRSPFIIKPPIAARLTQESSHNTTSEASLVAEERRSTTATATPRTRNLSTIERIGKSLRSMQSKLPDIRRSNPPNPYQKKRLTKPASGNLRIEHTGAFGRTATLDDNHKVAPQTGDIYATVTKRDRRDSDQPGNTRILPIF